ncbi:hypothetical protein [uncultured Jannaschia sp.]|uniref:hypothetical protein n=1 Tax=uncultured Jannaschia sp. TaxID=293347 RepID=UPI0026107B0A|nr:hypothetical protein [uncultured Jannaschia sp.]
MRSPAPVASAARPDGGAVRRVSWGAIFAGSVVTLALMILFTTFGIGIGAGMFDPQFEANPASGIGIGSAVYLLVSQLIALAAGGFIAGRLAGIPREISAMLHGASVWAVTTVFVAWAAIVGGSALFGAATSALGNTASAVGRAGEAIVPDDLSLPNPSNLAGSISLDALPEEVRTTLEEQGITERNIRQEATAAFRDVFSQEEQQAALTEARQTLGDILQSPADAGEEIQGFFDRLVAGPNAIISEEDRQQAINQMEQRLGVTPEEAESLVQSVQDGVQTAVTEARDAVEAARQQAVETAQAASDAISSTALILSLVSVLGLAAAAGGAFAGRPSRLLGDYV